MVRSYQDELQYLEKLNNYSWRIKKGFVPNMKVINSNYLNIFDKELTRLFYLGLGGGNILCERASSRLDV